MNVRVAVAVAGAGFRLDATHRRTATLTWLLTLLVALASAWPAWDWWAGALKYAPRGDVLAERVDLVVLKELVQFDRSSVFAMVDAALTAGLVLALLLSPLLAAGVLAVLAAPAPARVAPRFFDAGARYYWRFVRTLIYVGVIAGIVLAVTAGLGRLAIDAVSDRGLERAAVGVTVLSGLAVALVAAFFTAVLDLARVRLVLTDSPRALAAAFRALGFAARHLGPLSGIGVAYVGLLLPIAAVLLWVRASLPGNGWGWLAVAFLLQQVLSYVRLRLRVATMASELALARQYWEAPPPVQVDAVPVEAPHDVAPELVEEPARQPELI